MGVDEIYLAGGGVRDAGTYHVATGTWTRTVPTVRGVDDVIYNNTASVGGVFANGLAPAGFDSPRFMHAGRIPSTGSAGTANRDLYNVNSITIGYCVSDARDIGPLNVLVTMYSSVVPCEDPGLQVHAGEILVQGLPFHAPGIAGPTITCWIVNFDLSGGSEICLMGDGDGTFDADLNQDSFGVELQFDPGGLGHVAADGYVFGPLLAGDRQWTVQAQGELLVSPGAGVANCSSVSGGGGGTYFGPAECCAPVPGFDHSSGLDAQDQYWISARPWLGAGSGCYWFGGYQNPAGCGNYDLNSVGPGSFYLKVNADQSSSCSPSVGDLGFFCPPEDHSGGYPTVLTGLFNSGFETGLHLNVGSGPPPVQGSANLGYFLVGNMDASPGILVGDGRFCLAGGPAASFGRYNVAGTNRLSLGVFGNLGGLANVSGTGGVFAAGFDVPFDIDIPGVGAGTIMSGDTYYFQCWFRDGAAGAGHSNFSNALRVTFP